MWKNLIFILSKHWVQCPHLMCGPRTLLAVLRKQQALETLPPTFQFVGGICFQLVRGMPLRPLEKNSKNKKMYRRIWLSDDTFFFKSIKKNYSISNHVSQKCDTFKKLFFHFHHNNTKFFFLFFFCQHYPKIFILNFVFWIII